MLIRLAHFARRPLVAAAQRLARSLAGHQLAHSTAGSVPKLMLMATATCCSHDDDEQLANWRPRQACNRSPAECRVSFAPTARRIKFAVAQSAPDSLEAGHVQFESIRKSPTRAVKLEQPVTARPSHSPAAAS